MSPKERKRFMANLEENRSEERKLQSKSGKCYIWIARGIAVLLLFAAGMKAWQLATTPILPASGFFAFFEQRWVQIVIVEFEILWCVLLLNNFWPRFLWTGSLALFTGFTVFSILRANL